MICRDQYMQSVDGTVGDSSCGFNIDMHLAYSLFTLLVFGMLLYYSSLKESGNRESNITHAQ